MIDEGARELLASGVAIEVATRDASLIPDVTTAMGVMVRDATTILLYLPHCARTTAALRNIDDNGMVAATFTRPSDDRGVQMKGKVRSVRDATPDDRCIQELYRGGLAEQFAFVGIPRSVTRRLRFYPSVVVELEVREVYDQTPGPRAGDCISARSA
jgi:hypothetical protein